MRLSEIEVLRAEIAELTRTDAESLHEAPQNTRVGRLDETTAARKPVLKAAEDK